MPVARRIEHAAQPDLFGAAPCDAVEGLRYEPGFLGTAEEVALLQLIGGFALREMRYKAYTARRRGIGFGGRYDFDANRLLPGAPLPASLHPLRRRAAAWAGIDEAALTHALVAEYRPGTPLGWHRDVPDFEDIVGISLRSDAVLQLRPWRRDGRYAANDPTVQLRLEPRSIYLLRGAARWAWQHAIAPTEDLRYSITLRTRALHGRPATA